MSPPVVLHVAAIPATVEKMLLPQLQFLAECGYDVRVACASEGRPWPRDLMPFNPVDVAFPRALKPAQVVRAALSLPMEARRMNASIVHLHTPAAALPARLLPPGAFGRDVKIVYTVHGFAHQWDQPSVRDRGLERLERLLARRTDAMLFQSAEDLQQAEEHQYPSHLRYLGNGVEDSWFDLPVADHQRPLTLLFVGRLVAGKGIIDLLQALALVPDTRLLIAGEGLQSDRSTVDQQVAALVASPELVGRVEVLGQLAKPELQAAMSHAHAFVLPSYREGLPRSVIEALAAGRPALVTAIRGCRELVTHELNGLVVPAGDVSALAGALRRLAEETGLLVRLTGQARPSVDPDRRETQVFSRLLEAYEGLGITASC